MTSFRPLPLLLLAVLAGCAQFPEVDAMPAAPVTTPPALLPMDQLLAQVNPDRAQDPADTLAGRAAGLRARAAALRATGP